MRRRLKGLSVAGRLAGSIRAIGVPRPVTCFMCHSVTQASSEGQEDAAARWERRHPGGPVGSADPAGWKPALPARAPSAGERPAFLDTRPSSDTIRPLRAAERSTGRILEVEALPWR